MPTITGTDSGETLAGTTGNDQISALGGNDTITLTTGDDVIDGGAGSDAISGAASSLSLPATARSYTITSDHIFDGSGVIDTYFSNVEQVRFSDYSGYDVTLDASARNAYLQFNLGAGNHDLTGGSARDFLTLAATATGNTSATVDGGAGDDALAFLVAPDSVATLTNFGDLFVLHQGTTRSAEVHNVETIYILVSETGTSGILLDASQVNAPISVITTDGRPDDIVGGSGDDTFETYVDGSGDILSGGSGADRYLFGRFDQEGLGALDGTTILDFDSDDVLDLNNIYEDRTFDDSDHLGGFDAYGTFTFRGATFVAGDWGNSLLTIASGAFILEETAPGSNLLMIAGAAPGPDPAPNVIVGDWTQDILEGGGGDDRINVGDADACLVDGGSGADRINGGYGQDTLYGGSGNDTIDGGQGFDTIRGGDGNDTLAGTGFESDWMMGGRGDDVLIANGGVWYLYGGDDPEAGWRGGWNLAFGGEDLSQEDDGNDRITLNNGYKSSIDGGSGNDTINVVGGEQNVVGGGSGNDMIKISGASAIAVDGGAGDDKITVSASEQVVVLGNAGDDALTGDAGNDTLDGGDGNDTLIGGDGDDWLRGGAGIDTVSYAAATAGVTVSLGRTSAQHTGGAGIDRLAEVENAAGSAFDDVLRGNDAANDLRGGEGADRLEGGLGDDTLNGGNGDDVLTGGGGADAMRGGAGDDLYYVDAAGDLVVEGADAGWDVVRAGVDYTLTANVEELFIGGAGRDGTGNALANTLHGSGSNNVLLGLGGDDIIRGGGGRDTLDGGDGADLLDGGVGKDTLTGGGGRDMFQFRDGDFGATRALADTIADFSHADAEKIHLSLADANTAIDGNQAFAWIGNGAFTGVAGQLHYAQAAGSTYVEGDTNGDGTADFAIALTGTLNLVASDFVL